MFTTFGSAAIAVAAPTFTSVVAASASALSALNDLELGAAVFVFILATAGLGLVLGLTWPTAGRPEPASSTRPAYKQAA
jgi:hypothetical protein